MDNQDDLQKFEEYLKRRFPNRRTAIDYLSDLRQFITGCAKPWREVSMHDIDAFVDRQRRNGLKPATIKRRVAALKTFFDFLAEESGDLSWPNPVRFKRHAGKQPRSLPRDLSDREVELLWQSIPSRRDRAWFALMLRAGLRVGEVTSLKREDLLLAAQGGKAAQLRVCGKGRKERMVYLTPDAYAVLQAWLAERPETGHEFVFLNERGAPLTANGIEWLLHQYGQRVGVEVTPHQLRHTFSRQVTEAGMPLPSLGKILGHAQITTTQIYTAGADPQLRRIYQETMQRLEQEPVAPPSLAAEARLIFPPAVPDAPTPPTQTPAWEQWARQLPCAIRQASLEFIQRRWLTWKPQRRKRHAERQLNFLRQFWTWQMAHRPIQRVGELTLSDLQAFQAQQTKAGKKPTSINNPLALILSLLREQADQGQAVDASVFRLRPLPNPENLPRHLTLAESQQLEAFVRSRLDSPDRSVQLENACFFVLAHTGLRACECLDLCLQDLDLSGGRLFVRGGKGLRDRVVYLSQTAQTALARYLGNTPRPTTAPLFVRANGEPIYYEWLYRCVAALGQAAGIPKVHPHRLRHTLATRLLNAGMEIARIQKLLGHEKLTTTMIYARVLDATVELDYRQAMETIERQNMPLSVTPMAADGWPAQVEIRSDRFIKVQNS